ncbi:MAG: protein O-mannosyl-transferase [Verrucomicrobiota bacterium]|jgi:hypothetical protein
MVTAFRGTCRLQTLVLLGLTVMTLAVFAGVRRHEFVHYDDAANIYDNPHVASLDGPNLRWMFTDSNYARRYMPLGWLCYAVNRQLFGLNPHAFHLVNLGLHLINGLLLFFLVKELVWISRGRPKEDQEDAVAIWSAGIAALFWAIHPLRVEVVAWASGQIYGVVFLLTMIWVLAWLKSQQPGLSSLRRRLCYGISIAAYGASLLTYPLAMFAPVILFALEVYPLRSASFRWQDWFSRRAMPLWRNKAPFLAVMILFLVLAILARAVPDPRYRPVSLADVGLFSRGMQAFYVWAYYVWKPWAPYDLAPVYPTLHAFNPFDPGFVVSTLLVVGLSAAALKLRRAYPGILALWICHLVLLVPVLGLSEYPHSAADRYSHVQGVFWSIAIGFGLRAIWNHGRHGANAIIVMTGISAIFGLLSWQQVRVWRDSIPLYQTMVSRMGEHPSASRWSEALGVDYLYSGLTNAALASFTNAVECEARRADRQIWDIGTQARSHQRIGDVFISLGRTSDAVDHYRASLEIRPGVATVVLRCASGLSQLGRDVEALEILERALEKEPANPALHHASAACLDKLGRAAEAARHRQEEQRLKAGSEATF